MPLYKICKTVVSDDAKVLSSFSVKVGAHQGSALSPLLFIKVMDILTEDVRDGSLMELWYADDLLLCGESLEKVMSKYGRWKNAVEGNYLKVNIRKCSYDLERSLKFLFVSKVDPPGVCGEWISCKSIQCTKCQRWIRGRFFVVPRKASLLSYWDVFVCRICLGHNCSLEEKLEFKRG